MAQYRRVEWEGETYRDAETKTACTFPKIINVTVDGEVSDHKLSYTTEYYDEHGEPCIKEVSAGKVLRPCIRVDGVRLNLDDPRVEVAEDCLL